MLFKCLSVVTSCTVNWTKLLMFLYKSKYLKYTYNKKYKK